MIRQQAFVRRGNAMLKGGLHCHTTRSDGSLTPEQVMRVHADNGYDFLALTDHRLYNRMNYAPETGLVVVPGVELDQNMPVDGPLCRHCFHVVCIGPMQGNGFSQDQIFPRGVVSDQFAFQRVLDRAHQSGNLTFYCHPGWSNTAADEFDQLQGNFAMEIWNSCCATHYDSDWDALYWDLLLRKGVRIFGVASDDGHKADTHCMGWVRVNGKKSVDAILEALGTGAFYSSCGPEIYDFYVDAGSAVIRCSPVARIRFHYGYAPTRVTVAQERLLEQGRTPVPDYYTYIRASVVDDKGRQAWTNPIFLK